MLLAGQTIGLMYIISWFWACIWFWVWPRCFVVFCHICHKSNVGSLIIWFWVCVRSSWIVPCCHETFLLLFGLLLLKPWTITFVVPLFIALIADDASVIWLSVTRRSFRLSVSRGGFRLSISRGGFILIPWSSGVSEFSLPLLLQLIDLSGEKWQFVFFWWGSIKDFFHSLQNLRIKFFVRLLKAYLAFEARHLLVLSHGFWGS